MSAEARLKELGLVLPVLPKPVANYRALPAGQATFCIFPARARDRRERHLSPGRQARRRDATIDEGYADARLAGRTRTRSPPCATHLGALSRDRGGHRQTARHGQCGAGLLRSLAEGDQRLLGPPCRSVGGRRDAMPARRSATPCCLTRFRSKSRLSLRSRRKGAHGACARRSCEHCRFGSCVASIDVSTRSDAQLCRPRERQRLSMRSAVETSGRSH